MAQTLRKVKVGFVGGGNMAEALVRGLVAAKYCAAAEILVSEPLVARRQFLGAQYGVRTTGENAAVFTGAETIVLAVKPGLVASVLAEAASDLRGKLVVSIAAGVTLGKLAAAAPGAKLVRVMSNTPALVGEGMSVLVAAHGVSAAERKRALAIFSSVGKSVEAANESLIDAVTGLSGSGPAFVFLFLEALADGGVKAGLPRTLAQELACQTVIGAARLAATTGKHTGELKDMVTSPGGTTIAGVAALEKGAFRAAVIEAVVAATERSKELGRGE